MNNSELQLNIISAERKIFSGTVTYVVIPGLLGKFGVESNHAPLISPLQAGTITYTSNGKEESVEVQGGIAEVNQNVVTICVQ